MNKNIRTIVYILISLILLAGVFLLGVKMGYNRIPEIEKVISITNKTPKVETTADFDPFWKAWNILNEKSINGKEVTDQEKVWGAIAGLASSMGDPYTTFFPPEENKEFTEEIKGTFSGIGAEIGKKDDVLTIVAPLKDTPAFKAGLKAGDKIFKINNESAMDISVDKAISLIRGEKGTEVILTILREGEKTTRDIKIIRDDINIPIIETELRDDGIFIINLYSFSENSANLFREALVEFSKAKTDKLILDLRGNPGGYLDSAVDMASWFVDEGKAVVREDRETVQGKEKVYRSHGPKVFNDNLKMVILVDGGSASASEILAGALHEYGVAKLVGEKTFGKGSVQELVKITDETSLKVTVANWLTPNGKSISKEGLTPDYIVTLKLSDLEKDIDPQMDKAVELLNK